jgi:hypothetical protein
MADSSDDRARLNARRYDHFAPRDLLAIVKHKTSAIVHHPERSDVGATNFTSGSDQRVPQRFQH